MQRLLRLLPVVALLCLSTRPARAAPEPAQVPEIDLFTMGPGDDLFSRFGHAALCVTDEASPTGRCYNYGTADFSTPLPLTWDFVRGRARFWVSVQDQTRMLAFYLREDRTVYRQRLPLPPAQAAALRDALEAATAEDVRYYRYHHFHDNCTTRLRDHIDAVTSGVLRRGNETPTAQSPTFRDFARRGFAGHSPDAVALQIVAELLLGRPADQRTSRTQAQFLPEILRQDVAARLGAAPETLHQRSRPESPNPTVYAGRAALCLLGLLLAALARITPRAGRVATASLLGLIAVVLWSLAGLSAFAELRFNEALLVFLPSDLALPLLAPRAARRYLTLRLGGLLIVALLALVGVLRQPLFCPLLLCALPFLALRSRLHATAH